LLSKITRAPLDNTAFAFGAVREIGIGPAAVIAARRTYVGELGWELYVPSELAASVYDALMEAGAPLGAKDAGYYAIESLRLEKGYRAWGRELTPDYNPYEAGLGFAVDLDKGDFLGRAALVAAKGKPLSRRLLSFAGTSADTPLAHGGELILRDGEPAGEITSASYGHTLGGIVALGYVTTGGAAGADLLSAHYEIDIAGDRVPVKASLKAPYDPANARVKG
jgi:4-methylaminobutanoate oxidase (formaldehyde-forming)